ncbi:hypothetical protein [Roseiconus lacunae]|uniref:hypothetical protein n=1 Tax=Roseiconus lacunae TaxID=2605694 RepID=UPI001E4775DD|nr:hypothetical protein [Roseiconus lacunae]MCD0459092.1 hypothetical protein [Roseiconus lacunae]
MKTFKKPVKKLIPPAKTGVKKKVYPNELAWLHKCATIHKGAAPLAIDLAIQAREQRSRHLYIVYNKFRPYGMSENTVRDHLKRLHQANLLTKTPGERGCVRIALPEHFERPETGKSTKLARKA